MARLALPLAFVFVLSGCASIQHTAVVEQPFNQQRTAGVGDVVLRIDKQRNLENIFGKASIWGKKTNEGFTEVRFAGVEDNGEVVLYRKDVEIITNETTSSRNPTTTTIGHSTTTAAGSYYGSGTYGTANATARTNSSSTTISPTSDYHVVVPNETIPIRFPQGTTRIPIEGFVVEILSATPVAVEYRILQQ
jgi:hypothetical protein